MDNSSRAGVLICASTLFRRSLIALAAVFVAGWFTSCSDDLTGPRADELSDEGAIVSDPVSSASLAAGANADLALSASAAQGDDVAYVSLPPRTVPGGSIALIRRVDDPGSIVTTVIDGGFDPVAVAAKEGDSIEVGVMNASGVTLRTYRVPVRRNRAPIIVRTHPPRGRPDVPLNTVIIVVFSEPIAGASVTPESIRLLRGTTPVGGTVRFLDPTLDASHVSVEFVSAGPLAANTAYQLVVTTQVRDLDGEGLAARYTTTFTTGQSSTGPPASIVLSPDSVLSLVAGATYQVTATVRDAAGNMLTNQPVTWSTSDPNGLSVSPTGRLMALGDGSFLVTARVGVVSRVLMVFVSAGAPASVAISPTPATVAAGDTIMLAATVRDAAGRTINRPSVTWTSSAPAVATVAPSNVNTTGVVYGTVTGVSQGSVTITATSGTASGTASVTAIPPQPVASVHVTPNATLIVQGTAQIGATLRDANGRIISNRPITWTSSNAAVATVDANGLVTGVSVGSASVTATSEGVSGAAAITVTTLSFASVTAGLVHTCGVTTSGAAFCWGWGDAGQLGTGFVQYDDDWGFSFSTIPATVAGGLTFSVVAAGGIHTCGLTTDGAAHCWGFNRQLGTGSNTGPTDCAWDLYLGKCSLSPVATTGGLRFSALAASYWGRRVEGHTCGLTSNGTAHCWGVNTDGQLGAGPASDYSPIPVAVTGGLTFAALHAGALHTCGLTRSGAAYCWGYNGHGQLGNGSSGASSSAPVAVTGGLTFIALSGGAFHTCALTTSGGAYCWGSNYYGQLGISSTSDFSSVPTAVTGGHTFTSLGGGGWHTCALKADGAAYCWGFNDSGQLGIGTAIGPDLCAIAVVQQSFQCSRTPRPVTGGLTFAALGLGGRHSCGLTRNGIAYCWGNAYYGQLGTGSQTDSSVPVKVAGQP